MTSFPAGFASRHLRRAQGRGGFTLVELLVVMAIIAILIGASAALVPSMLRGNQMNADVNTLAGLLENARSTAISGNTYVYVGFTAAPVAPANPADGISVIVFESQDGTDVAGGFANPITFPTTPNVQLVGRIQRLPGVTLADVNGTSYTPTPALTTPAQSLVGFPSTTVAPLPWKFTTTTTLSFIYGFEFAPNGEAKVSPAPVPPATAGAWYDLIEFGLTPAIAGQNPKDVAVIRISRLTGKANVLRP